MDLERDASASNLLRLSDEELGRMASQGSVAARNVLVLRYLPWALRQSHTGGPGSERFLDLNEHLVEAVFFALLEAVQLYDPTKANRFTTYLRRVMRRRLSNSVRDFWRRERLYDRSVQVAEDETKQHRTWRTTGAKFIVPVAEGSDPHLPGDWTEMVERVRLALGHLSERQRQLWLHLADGTTIQVLAQRSGVSPRTMRRWRFRLLAELGARME